MYNTTLEILYNQCPRLHSLTIHYDEDMEVIWRMRLNSRFRDGFHESQPIFSQKDLSSFSNLSTLEVTNLYGDIQALRSNLVQVLIRSPNLRTLGLSLSISTTQRLRGGGSVDDIQQYVGFMNLLCEDFVTSGVEPLKLRKLTLGLSVVAFGQGHHLTGLTDLKHLEDVYVYNEDPGDVFPYSEYEHAMTWIFTPENCPNLTKFGIYRYTEPVKQWVNCFGRGYIRQFNTEYASEEELCAIQWDLEDTRVGLRSTLTSLTANIDLTMDEWELETLPAIDVMHLQALSAVTMHETIEHQEDILVWLGKATNLQQLFLAERSIPNIPCNATEQPIENGFEQKLALLCQKLEYLRLNQNAWRIWRSETADKVEIHFERLDRFEARSIEVFQPRIIFRDDW